MLNSLTSMSKYSHRSGGGGQNLSNISPCKDIQNAWICSIRLLYVMV